MNVKNAKTKPETYYGLHMEPGVAEYREDGKEPFRIMIGETTIKNMDPSFSGLPVFVQHVEEVDLENLQAEADGYVWESFYNKADGKHWVKFIAVSDEAKEAIKRGWTLSNAYFPKEYGNGGSWHGVDYEKEVLIGEYEHLAIVPNPRYENSVIYTPEEFKAYNIKKEDDLKKLVNSKEGDKPMFTLFTKTKITNEKIKEMSEMMVTLPKSKKEMTLEQVVNALDEKEVKEAAPDQMANVDHMVEVAGEKMSVAAVLVKLEALCKEIAAASAEADPAADASLDNEEDDADDEVVENEEDDADDEMVENEEDAPEKKDEKKDVKKNSKPAPKATPNADKLRNAQKNAREAAAAAAPVVSLCMDQVAVGKARYGNK